MKSAFFKQLLFFMALIFLTMTFACDEDPSNTMFAPTISKQVFEIPENSFSGTSVGFIQANDLDSEALIYSINSGNQNATFELNPATGELTVQDSVSLDFESNPLLFLVVSVSDGNKSNSATITIKLLDVDETNQLQFYGKNYELVDGLIVDYGIDFLSVNHYHFDFTIGDDQFQLITTENSEFFNCVDCEILAYTWLESPGIGEFQPGVFELIGDDETVEDLVGEFFAYDFSLFQIDKKTDEITYFSAMDATITVEQNSELNYTLKFEATIQKFDDENEAFLPETETELVFIYSGSFKYLDLSENSGEARVNSKKLFDYIKK